ncbi:non-ribosomal peptide synthetase, partial [Marilutibacter spongiae]
WTQHHILLDGWCLPLVYRDVMRLYYASMEGREAALPAPVPYERYIGWLQSREEAQARAHWRAVLGDVEAPTPLAIDRLGGDGEGYREQVLVLGAGPTQALQALAKSRHTTVNTLVQWAWGYVLHRYSGEGSVVFGATISGRTAPVAGIEEMVGLFINTIPVRVDYAASEPLEAGIARLHREFQQGNEHGYLSLPEIQRQSGVAPGTALFDSILAFENYPLDAMSDLGSVDESTRIRMEATGNDEQTNYALTLNVMLGEALEVKAGFRAERLAAAAVVQVLRHLGRVLEQLPAAVGEGARIDLVDEDEAGGLLAQGRVRRHHRDLPRVHERFQAQARAHPDAIALAHGDERMSYGELNRRANRVAHRLRRSGVGADDRVGLCVERGFEMLIGVIGILKAGAGYVPLDPAYPAERLAFMLQDCRPKAVLTQAGLLASGVLPDTGATEVVSLDDAGLAGEADTDPADVRVDDASLAYVIYTSGSTGKPKGVMVEHRQLNRLFASTRETFGFDHEDVWTLFHSFAFDFSVWEMWGALLHGGRLVIVPAPLARDPEGMWGLLEREGVTVLNQTPSAFRALQAAQPPDTSHRLRAVVFGGEALELSSLLPWFERNGDATRMVNMYGITETTVHVTCREIDMEDARRARGSLIGQPLDDLALYVLDESMRPCPLGVRGELYVGGDGVARGYLDREALTAERFVEATSFEGGRLYRTGDLARWLPGGELEYLGRNDFQVKIRGYRIELGEVEARLAACEGVRESVVLALDDPSGGKRLVAYVVMDGVDGRGVASLREAMSRDLAAHMLPSAFVELQAMPLTPNGKLDRKALPAPDRGAAASREYEAPADEVEQAVADAWQALLGVERVGRHDNFFELGGHSLLAVRMLGDLRTRFGMEMDIRDVFEKTTVSALAAYIAERRSLVALKDALAFDVVDQDEEFTEL